MSKILVIDDDTMVTKLLDEFLTGEGHDVTIAHTGGEGFNRALEIVPDLILQDVMLPDATGFQMVDRFRQEPTTQPIPIIMMSGAARHTNQQRLGNMMGADDYVLKPFTIDDMDQRIQKLLRGERTPPPAPPPTPSPVESAIPRFSIAPEFPEELTGEQSETISQFSSPTFQKTPVAYAMPAPAMTEWKEEAPPKPVAPVKVKRNVTSLSMAQLVFVLHLCTIAYNDLAVNQSLNSLFHSLSRTTCGWLISLGLLVTVSALFKISLDGRPAIRLLGWAMVPLLFRSLLTGTGFQPTFSFFPAHDHWLKSLDVFAVTAILIQGMRLRNQPGGTLFKSLFSMVFLCLSWLVLGGSLFLG